MIGYDYNIAIYTKFKSLLNSKSFKSSNENNGQTTINYGFIMK